MKFNKQLANTINEDLVYVSIKFNVLGDFPHESNAIRIVVKLPL